MKFIKRFFANLSRKNDEYLIDIFEKVGVRHNIRPAGDPAPDNVTPLRSAADRTLARELTLAITRPAPSSLEEYRRTHSADITSLNGINDDLEEAIVHDNDADEFVLY